MVTATGSKPSLFRRLSAFFNRRPRLRLAALLTPPLGWMIVVYLGALVLLLLTAFWKQDVLTSEIQREWGLDNFKTLVEGEVYRSIALRTLGIALAVTVADVALAIPIAYFAARIAKPRWRTLLLISIVLPLWSSYLVRVYAWRVILSGNGILNWALSRVGLGSIDIGYSNWAIFIVFTYLWLPYVTLPIYSAFERIPDSLIEASTDLGASWGRTFRKVILPMALPGIVAGTIFSFSLTLGDYIAPQLVGNTLFIGNVVDQNVGVANNLPLAAAYALVPMVIVAVYLLFARRMKALDAL
jgi:putative spermidine/putrescine transport system permease protein